MTLGTNGFFEVLQAKPANDNTVRTRVTGLPPGKTFHYFFAQGGKRSAVGTFETAPSANAPKTIRFAFSGDADAQHGKGQSNIFYDSLAGNNGFTAQSFGIYHQMAAEKNDFNVNLGDTIYSDTEVPGGFPIARTLAAKRAKYRQNLAVANLRALRRSTGVYSQWDDHEFINDFTRAQNSPVFKVGVQAFREYMPVHYTSTGGLYNTERWGRNLQLFRLDERSFRSAKASFKHTCDNPQTHKPDLAPTAPQSTRNTFSLVIPSFSSPVSQACKDKINDPKRTMLGKALAHHGYAVWLAAGGLEAVDFYRQHQEQVDLVLLDVVMPEMSGRETLAALQKINPYVHCCFISGEPNSYPRESLLALGASAVLEKPFGLVDISHVLRETLG